MTMPFTPRSLLRPLALSLVLAPCAAGAGPYSIDASGTLVTDQATALQWDRCTWGQTWNGTGCTGWVATPNWYQALQAAPTANVANHLGYSDWRLPNVSEMESLMEMDSLNPNIDLTAFPTTQGKWYWTSTTYEASMGFAWYVNFFHGHVFATDKLDLAYVRLVRSGQLLAAFEPAAAPGPGPGPGPVPGTPGAAQPVPTLGEWALALLATLLGTASAMGLRQRRKG